MDNKFLLIVEDDDTDFRIISKSLKSININIPIKRATNGSEGIDLLKEENTLPCLVILDLNMPGVNGFDFLETVKSDDNLKQVPVTVFTSSNHEGDKLRSLELGAQEYLIKPIGFSEYMDTLKKIDWERYLNGVNNSSLEFNNTAKTGREFSISRNGILFSLFRKTLSGF